MIQIDNKKDCCGCGACAARCPKQCITLQSDEEGFLYPKVDIFTCIDCGLCEKVCPMIHPHSNEENQQKAYAAINPDDEVRLQSSSGGVFTILAEQVLTEGGVVFGARFDEQWQVVIDYTEHVEGLAAFRGSKYVQARTGNSYQQCERFLKAGRKVLFSGTPCQVSGLHRFLRKSYSQLITVDFICHGTPSPLVWGKYLQEVVEAGKQAIGDHSYRVQRLGWKRYKGRIENNVSEGLSLCFPKDDSHYMRAFLSDLILRPSCATCPAKEGRSHADLTIADLWGAGQILPEMDDNKGTSLLFVNTIEGEQFLQQLPLRSREINKQQAVSYNSAYLKSVVMHPKREEFFNDLPTSTSVTQLIDDKLRPTFIQSLIQSYWRIRIYLVKRLLHRSRDCKKGKYISEEDISQLSVPMLHAVGVNFRDKAKGWSSYELTIALSDKKNK